VLFHSFEPGIASFGLTSVLAAAGLALFGADFARLDPARRRAHLLAVLRTRRILLVWDNFETVYSLPTKEQATPALDDIEREKLRAFVAEVARDSRGGLVITSRSPEPWLGEELGRLELRGLAREATYELVDALLAGLPRAVERERRRQRAFSELLEELGGHPLSLRLVLPHLEHMEAPDLLEALRGLRGPLAGADTSDDHLSSLGACVRYSFHRLDSADQDRLPALVFFVGVADARVLALLSEQKDVPARFAGIDRTGWEATLDRASRAGLVTALSDGVYQIHPALPGYLTSLWIRRAASAFVNEYGAAGSAYLFACDRFTTWLQSEIGLGSELATKLLSEERRPLAAAARHALEAGVFPIAQSIFEALDNLWKAQGLFAEADAWADYCRQRLEQDGQPPDLDSPAGSLWLFMVGAQAHRWIDSGRLDAAEAQYKSVLHLVEARAGSGDATILRRLAVTYHQLGLIAQERGDLDAAEAQ
jgi:hypothetical protein